MRRAFLFALLVLASLSNNDKRIGWPGDNIRILIELLCKEWLWIGPSRYWMDQKFIRFRWMLLPICTFDGSEKPRRCECKSCGWYHDWLTALVLSSHLWATSLDCLSLISVQPSVKKLGKQERILLKCTSTNGQLPKNTMKWHLPFSLLTRIQH